MPTEHRVPETHGRVRDRRVLVRAGVISLVASVAIMAAKFAAYLITSSTAILADAAESVINVVAATIVTVGVAVASRPADEDHPYGHGKAEFLSAAVEGGMILVAATLIVVEAVRVLVVGPEVRELEIGMLVAGGAGVANLVLGLYLRAVGRRERSAALEADGVHVLSDVITTVGALGALAVVRITDFTVLDPLAAIAVSVHLLRTGWRVFRGALAGLLDEADFDQLQTIARYLQNSRRPEWVEIHQLRTWSSGSHHHVDLHLTVPRYLSVEEAHAAADELERGLLAGIGAMGDVVVHVDPCLPHQCPGCSMQSCPVRASPRVEAAAFTVQSLTKAGTV